MDHHSHAAVLDEFLIILTAACVVVPIFQQFRLSPMLGYLVAGLLIGPHALGVIKDVGAVARLAEFGVVFLLFAIGLELSLERLRVMRHTVFGLGTAQVATTGVVLYAAGWLAGLDTAASVVLAGGLALSSTAIVLQELARRGELVTQHGRIQVSILLLQDLAVVPLLALVPLLTSGAGDLATALGLAFLKGVGALSAIILIGRLVVRPLLHMIGSLRQPELFTAVTLLIVIGTGWLTERAGISMALGAFLAGLMIAETEFRHQVEADIEPFRGILLSLFFMTVGMSIDISLILTNLLLVGFCVVALILVKAAIVVALVRIVGYPMGLAMQVGLGLSQGGEFGFVLFGLAIGLGVLPTFPGQIALAVIAITIALTPFLNAAGRHSARRMVPPAKPETERIARDAKDVKNHVLIAGFGRVGQTIARLLDTTGTPYICLDLEPDRVAAGRNRGIPVYYGDASRGEVLKAAGAARARAAVVTLDHPHAALRTVAALKQAWPDMAILVRARDGQHVANLREAGAYTVVPEVVEGSLHLGGALLSQLGMTTDYVTRVLDQFREEAYARLGNIIPARPQAHDDTGR